jgi:hypothetical protein
VVDYVYEKVGRVFEAGKGKESESSWGGGWGDNAKPVIQDDSIKPGNYFRSLREIITGTTKRASPSLQLGHE